MPRSPSLLHVVSPLMSSAPPTILRFDMAAMAAVPDVGFDVVAAKIRSIQYDYCPVYGTATGALIRSSRHLKESFTKGAGKRVVDASDTTAPASRRRAVAVTPSLGVPLTRFHPVWISYLQGLDIFLRENSIVSVVP